jgi:hypothetical protein
MSRIPIGKNESMDDLDQMSNSEIEQITWAVSSSATWNQPQSNTITNLVPWNQSTGEWGSNGETIPWSNGLSSSIETNKIIVPIQHDEDNKFDNKNLNSLIKIVESFAPIENNDNKKKIKPISELSSKPILEEIEVEENIVEQAETAWTEVKPRRKKNIIFDNKKNDSKYKSKPLSKKY